MRTILRYAVLEVIWIVSIPKLLGSKVQVVSQLIDGWSTQYTYRLCFALFR